MTEHKHLKRRVRDRMAKTGESYTTALRHVAGARVAPAGRPFGGGTHHESTLLAHLLPEFSEAMFAGLGGGIGFLYSIFEYKDTPPMLTIVAQAHPEPMIPLALTRAGVEHEILQTGSPRVAERNLLGTLTASRAAICRVSRYALPWRPGLPFPDPLEVTVTELDGDTVLVEDECLRPHPLPLRDFLAAWSAPKQGRHHLLRIVDAAPRADLAGAVREAIRGTVAKLTGPVLGNSFDVNFGLSGMRRLAGQLADTKGKRGWAARFAEPEAFYIAMTRLRECLEVDYTAPAATRPLYAEFLDEAAELVGGGPCADAAALYREAGRLWAALAAAAVSPQPLAVYRELAEERAGLLLTEGARAADRLREINDLITALPRRHGLSSGLDLGVRTALLASLADLAAQVLAVEEEAVRVLRAV